jgi:hypothetical protein
MTEQALHGSASVSSLREVIDAELRTIATRLDGIEHATTIFNENLTRVPTDTDKQISHLRELHSERFSSVGREFAAVKEATIEMRGAFTKQIDSISAMIGNQVQNADGKISDLKDRLTAIESRASGGHLVRTERRLDTGTIVSLIVAGIMAASLLLSVAGYAAIHASAPHDAPYQAAPLVIPAPR